MLHTQKRPRPPRRFVILIPHRDAGRILDDCRRKLFSAGFSGAYSFPAAAPLAAAARPFSREELKELARNLRELIDGANAAGGAGAFRGGKIIAGGSGETAFIPLWSPFRPKARETTGLFGPVLRFGAAACALAGKDVFPETAKEKVLCGFFPPALACALAEPGGVPGAREALAGAPALSFRAAAVANLALRPLAGGERGYSYEWKIGPPVWLPSAKKRPKR